MLSLRPLSKEAEFPSTIGGCAIDGYCLGELRVESFGSLHVVEPRACCVQELFRQRQKSS